MKTAEETSYNEGIYTVRKIDIINGAAFTLPPRQYKL